MLIIYWNFCFVLQNWLVGEYDAATQTRLERPQYGQLNFAESINLSEFNWRWFRWEFERPIKRHSMKLNE